MILDEGIANADELAAARATEAKDAAYNERNRLVALLATMFPAWVGRTEIEGWDPEWHGCVHIDTPAGQLSWHFHDREAPLFDWLPPAPAIMWDGHTTVQKYERIEELGSMFRRGEYEIATPMDSVELRDIF